MRTKKIRQTIYRIYFYFRRGYTTYLGFVLGMGNFLVIQYRLLVERLDILKSIFGDRFIIFAIIMSIIIFLVAVILGWWDMHRGSFIEEARISWENNPEFVWLKEQIEDIKKKLDALKNKES